MKKILERTYFILLIAASISVFVPQIFAQNLITIPGQFSGVAGTGQKIKVQATKAGKYLFQIKTRHAESGKDSIAVVSKIMNFLKISLKNSDGNLIGSNFYKNKDKRTNTNYGDYFVVNIDKPQTLTFEIQPLLPQAKNLGFQIIADYTAPPVMVMGMELSNFLAMIATVVLLTGMLLFYRIIIKPLRGMNVQQVMERGEALRAAREAGKESIAQLKSTMPDNSSGADSGQDTASVFCGKCGLPRESGADFCGECGTRFED